ncbi:MAG TPA: response regulator [Steroidobacteraceae bacterium]|jgi:FixJ family two-component response regulator
MDKSLATVFIVDDDADLCRAVSRLLNSAGYQTRTFSSSAAFLAGHDPELPGCIILDLSMPDLDGFEVQAALAASGCLRPIIFLTGNGSIAVTVTAMRAGAVNFLVKPVEELRLFEAVEEALKIDAAERHTGRMRRALVERLGTLTPREREVLEHVVRGRLNKQIAADLGTVEKTIKVHRARVMHKMGARSLAELVQLAGSAGIGVQLANEPQAQSEGSAIADSRGYTSW